DRDRGGGGDRVVRQAALGRTRARPTRRHPDGPGRAGHAVPACYHARVTRIGWILAFSTAIAGGCGGRPAIRQRALPGDLAIVGATVLPMDREATLPGHTILVRGDRIVAVAPDA